MTGAQLALLLTLGAGVLFAIGAGSHRYAMHAIDDVEPQRFARIFEFARAMVVAAGCLLAAAMGAGASAMLADAPAPAITRTHSGAFDGTI